MRHLSLSAVLISAATLGGCNEGVLNPQGPIAVAERQILFNSLGIMLAIVIPVILATLGVAFWFRATNRRASYRPDFVYSGRIEVLVWSIPLMTVLLVGGVAWVGSHDLDPRKPLISNVTRHRPSRLPRLEMALHLSRSRHRQCQSSRHPGGHADQPGAYVRRRHEQLLRAAAWQSDLHDGRNDDASSASGRQYRKLSGTLGAVQRRWFCRHDFKADAVSGSRFLALGGSCTRNRTDTRRASLRRSRQPSKAVAPFTYHSVASDLFSRIVMSDMSINDPIRRVCLASPRVVQ